ncbi:MAG TPA: HAMP domain-containing sensor histidine kinase [Gemmatimonadaceae bacterium]
MPTTAKHAWPVEANELRPALQLIVSLARADMGFLMLHDEHVERLFPVLAHGMTDSECALLGQPRSDEGIFGLANHQHRRVRVRNAWSDRAALRDFAQHLGFRHFELIPFFRQNGGLLGAFAMIYRNRHATRRHAEKLEDYCAEVVAAAVSHAHLQMVAEDARERIASATREKSQFFARMSHELRTPLQSISGYVDLLRTSSAHAISPAQDRMLARISESERILVRMIDDLITYSRLEAGHVTYRIAPIAAQEALRSTEAVVSPLAIDHHVCLDVTACPPDLLVRADGDKLKQILVNLAANAIKFTKPGGKIVLSCQIDSDSVAFSVTDTGAGIAHDQLHAIFEPYVQLETPVANSFGGSGLGLAISREFASGMSGTLSVESELGHGSVFTLRLPRDVPLAAAS